VFAESVGVGTPCLLARSAAVAEKFSPEELRSFTFDPYLPPDRLAIVLKKGIERRESLLAEQQSVLQRMVGRTWRQVTGEYMAAFEMAALAVQAERRRQSHSNRLLTQRGGA
jgi:hypothetical protein